ncbi:MAG: GyrI-like domain-containing protein [Melioribacteraceae bacterium]|nr:GyrI-like domain-containing protein [Melioribacteraceae bacterium]MCF8264816.1 GyrI-like domain-containing protein [Melioribacteraceae bacterium]MCF8414405.1 GyrI-like domain-containing protein [Melioribacteraceae bacterium]MCF8430359.1 GyrI-like domain-containing protein [Melioribacteraceae bacterium]
MEKIDLKKELKQFYKISSKSPEIVDVPEFKFLKIDGEIEKGKEPGNSTNFEKSVEALYATAYTIKFACKKNETNPIDFVVMPLEGLWDLKDKSIDEKVKDNWKFTLMILMPDFVTNDLFLNSQKIAFEKKGNLFIKNIRFENFNEGLSVQMLHIGAYADEPKTVDKMKSLTREKGFDFIQSHHEIYLSDPRKSDPEKLKTGLRYQIKKR